MTQIRINLFFDIEIDFFVLNNDFLKRAVFG